MRVSTAPVNNKCKVALLRISWQLNITDNFMRFQPGLEALEHLFKVGRLVDLRLCNAGQLKTELAQLRVDARAHK